MSKIKLLDKATIVINNGAGEIHISESFDGSYNIEIIDNIKDTFRLGLRDSDRNIEFKYLSSFKPELTQPKEETKKVNK